MIFTLNTCLVRAQILWKKFRSINLLWVPTVWLQYPKITDMSAFSIYLEEKLAGCPATRGNVICAWWAVSPGQLTLKLGDAKPTSLGNENLIFIYFWFDNSIEYKTWYYKTKPCLLLLVQSSNIIFMIYYVSVCMNYECPIVSQFLLA